MDSNEKVPVFGKRYVQIMFTFFLLAIAIGMRVQLAVALVAMTDESTSKNPDVPVFDWNNKSVLLSSFYWGYLWLQVLAGNLGRVYGTKYFLMAAMCVNSTLHLALPFVVAKWDWYGLIVCRALQGLSQGFFYPSVNDILSKWSPISERARLGNLAYSGASFGIILTNPIVAIICTTWQGWPLSFYIYAGLGYLWVVAFYFFGASSPSSHPSISDAERVYIESDLDTEGRKAKIPWKGIIFNVPFWAAFISQVGLFWTNLTLLTETPTYLSKVMKFEIAQNGVLSSAPYLASFLLVLGFGYLGDYIINNNILSLVWTRKAFTTFGSAIPAAALLVLGFLPSDAITLSIVMLIVAVGAATACGSGSMINHIDLSPNFAAVLMGIINSSGCLVSILGPLAVQFIVTDETNKSQWKIIFIISAFMYIVPSILFMFFASADVQPYDSLKERDSIQKRRERLKKHSVISVLSI